MARLSQAERERVLAAIADAERLTTAEFSVAVVSSADAYAELRLLIPGLLAIVLPPLLLVAGWVREPFWLSCVPAITFVTTSALLLPDEVAMRLVPSRLRIGRARRLAQAMFVELGLTVPRDRAGVLLFIARAERQVEILAGAGVAERIDSDAWQAVVDAFVQAARSGPLAPALADAIQGATSLLSAAFPPDSRNPDEVPNRFIEL